jgi:hypothetical protein
MAASSPLILHAHIPKTAGTSINRVLEKNFETGHLRLWDPNPLACFSLTDLEQILDQHSTLISLSSHALRQIWPQIRDRPTLPITFLRNPTSQFLSLLRYAKQEFDLMPAQVKKVKKWWPQNTPELGMRDLADNYLAHNLRLTGSGQFCQQTRFFCPPIFTRTFFTRHSTVYGHNSLSIARRVLDGFFFVGLVEQMEQSLQLLHAKLSRFGIELSVPRRVWENRTLQGESLDWLTDNDSVGRRVFRANRNDMHLYKRFTRRFQLEFERWCGRKRTHSYERQGRC